MQTSEVALDQADSLRRIVDSKPVKVIAVSSGKGGVGKTNISVNLSVSLAKMGREVMLMDADLGLANVDVLLGLNPSYDLSHVISGERTLEEVVVSGPADLKIIPASSGVSKMANLQTMEQAGLIQAFSELGYALDVLVVDTGAGISGNVVNFCSASQEVIVVVCDEPASITDAYAFLKVMSREHGIGHFQILANMAHTVNEGREMYHKLSTAAERFLDVTLTFMGSIPYDPRLRKAVQHQRALVEAFPKSPAAQAISRLARQVDDWPSAANSGGQLEFFIERLVNADTDMNEA